MDSFRDDECFSHPGNLHPACAFCTAYRVGLRGYEAVSKRP